MATFSFALQAVLEQRKRLQDQCQREVAELLAGIMTLKNQLASLNAAIGIGTTEMRRGNLVGKIDLAYWAAHHRFIAAMQHKATVITQEISALKAKLATARQRLSTAAVQYRTVEKLRQRQSARWQQEHSRKEMIGLDEISTQLANPQWGPESTR